MFRNLTFIRNKTDLNLTLLNFSIKKHFIAVTR